MTEYLDTRVLNCENKSFSTFFILESKELKCQIKYKIPQVINFIEKDDIIEFHDAHFDKSPYVHFTENFPVKEINHDNYARAIVYRDKILGGKRIILELEAEHMKILTDIPSIRKLENKLLFTENEKQNLQKELLALKKNNSKKI